MKIVSIVVAALFIVTCLFNSIAVAESKVVGKWEKKKSSGGKRKHLITDSIEKRKATLKASFRRAGISQNDIDEIFSDERIEVYYNIYPPPELNEGKKKKKKLNYFDEEFGLHKPESIESGKKIIADNKELFEKIESLYANYLHRVSWKTGNEKKMRRAVYSYNHEKAYVNAVFSYAEKI